MRRGRGKPAELWFGGRCLACGMESEFESSSVTASLVHVGKLNRRRAPSHS